MSSPVLYRDIENFTANLDQLKTLYLKRWGWKMTCNTPGSYWLWQRDFSTEDAERHRRWEEAGPGPLGWPSEPQPYGVITASMDTAISMTVRSLDPRSEEENDDE